MNEQIKQDMPRVIFVFFGMPVTAEAFAEMYLGDELPGITCMDGSDILMEPAAQKPYELEAHEPMDLRYLLPETKPLHPYGPAHRRGKGKMRKFA